MNLSYTFRGARELYLTDPTSTNQAGPVVLLLHGMGDDLRAWTDPADHPDRAYDYAAPLPADRDIGWREYPGVGIWSFELDPVKEVSNWRQFLEEHDFRVAAYSQVDNVGFLEEPVLELGAVMNVLRTEIGEEARIAVLAQSRGGILARKFIKDNLGDPALVGAITHVITLHTSHQGSSLANVADTLRGVVEELESALGKVATDALAWLKPLVGSDAYQELAVGSAFLTGLADGETPLPGAEYHTFGGTSVRLTRVRSWVYTFGSAIPNWRWPPFFHTITMVELPGVSPLLDSLPNVTAEVTEGEGDMLVAESRSHLDFSVHHGNSLSHAESLWDPGLQVQVLQILRGTPGFWD